MPYVKLEGLDEVLQTMGKEAAGAKPGDFVDNSLVRQLEQEEFFRKLFPELK
ncbi:MAG: hypothetical protein ACREQK_20265 [Candidatus Binatia bacterium]